MSCSGEMRALIFLLSLVLSVLCHSAFAQKVVTDRITYTYVIPETESLKLAELSAVKHAQIQLIAENFGTIVESSSTILVADSYVNNFTIGETDVKGEWIETLDTPRIVRKVINDQFVIEVTISGRIREIVNTPIDCQCSVFKNISGVHHETTSFMHGDFMAMSFQAPVEGYLSVYLTDFNIVQCLYPYRDVSVDHMKVEQDRNYILFSKEYSGSLDPARVPRMRLGCTDDHEPNRLYVIFSPNKYAKAVDADAGNLPRQLGFEDFHAWLSKARKFDKEMSVRSIDITISRK